MFRHITSKGGLTFCFVLDLMERFNLFTFKYMIIPRSIFGIPAGD